MTELNIPLIVDLDGTVAKVDTFHEQFVHALLRHPIQLLAAAPSLFQSRTLFKVKLARIAFGFPRQLPWNPSVVANLTTAKKKGDQLIALCTATNQTYASNIGERLGLFAEIFGSDDQFNLKGKNKATFLRQRFGSRGFCYYGNEAVDLEVWKEAAKAYVITDGPGLLEKVQRICPDVEHIPAGKSPLLSSLTKELRPHQWTKNLLIFVPLLTSHRFAEKPLVCLTLAAFGIFCLLSSAVYVLNDLLDLDPDRLHATKKLRPFAAGDLSVLWGPPIFVILATIGLGLAFSLSHAFGLVCAGYLALTILYSTVIKKQAVLDVYTLASLYTLRLLAGGAVGAIPISVWLGAFSIFIFLSLALCKRYTEISDLPPDSEQKIRRRGYYASDASFVLSQGLIFMGCATLVLAVYLSSNAVTLLYKTPSFLWLAVLVVSFWGGRLWLLASRRQMHDDPVFFALKDIVSWICLAVLCGVFFAAIKLG